jgi:dynein heavy chain
MPLVIFDDALFHLLRLTRTVNAPAGNSLLVGVGGSGKQSLTKLSAWICHHRFFQIALTKSYNEKTLMEDIKDLFDTVCGQNGQVSFIMTDAEIKNDGFLEAINALLATGEIPGMLNKDDRDMFMLMVKPYLQKEKGKGYEPTTSELGAYFLNAVRDRLHIILAFSPVGTKFRTRASMFPSLFSECSVDWFLPWPKEALTDVSKRSLGNFEIEATKEVKAAVVEHMGEIHKLCEKATEEFFEKFRRNVYVTPKSYLSFIAMYKDLYKNKWTGIDSEQKSIKSGLDKLEEAVEGVGEMKKQLLKDDAELQKATKETDALITVLQKENAAAEEKQIEVGKTKDFCIAKKAQIEIEKEDADRDLKQAMPFVKKAESALNGIKDNDIVELKNAARPFDITKLIMDTVEILYQLPLMPVTQKEFQAPGRRPFTFIADSYNEYTFENLFIKDNLRTSLTHFGHNLKNFINDETLELLEPYL